MCEGSYYVPATSTNRGMHISGLSGLKVSLWSPRWGQRGLRGKPAKQRWTVGSAQWLIAAPPWRNCPVWSKTWNSSAPTAAQRYCKFGHRMLYAECAYQGSPHIVSELQHRSKRDRLCVSIRQGIYSQYCCYWLQAAINQSQLWLLILHPH